MFLNGIWKAQSAKVIDLVLAYGLFQAVHRAAVDSTPKHMVHSIYDESLLGLGHRFEVLTMLLTVQII